MSFKRFNHGVDLLYPDTGGALDDWQPVEGHTTIAWLLQRLSLPLVFGLMGLGAWARIKGRLVKEDADRLRRVCFTWLLPSFLLRHIWLCQIDSKLYSVGCYSFALHGMWLCLSLFMARGIEPHNVMMRGWTMMMTQGTLNSFLYPLLLRHEAFGERALACAVLWDLGGNMWICQFALFAVAAHFAPGGAGGAIKEESSYQVEDVEFNSEENDTLLSKDGADQISRSNLELEGRSFGSVKDGDVETLKLCPCMPRRVLIDALRQPVLICCVLGFLMNCSGAPLPSLLETPLWVMGEPYKLVLYFLVGYYGDHRLRPGDGALIGRTLGTRYAISSAIILIVYTVLPLELMFRHTLALVILSPTSSYLIHLVAEHEYGEAMLRLTVCGAFASTLFSTFSQHVLISIMGT